MPIIDGKKVKARYTSLKLAEISSVDNPAQPGARGAVVKRMETLRDASENVAKYVCDDDGAHSFVEVLAENKFSQEIWPFTDALSQSIRSIVGDMSLSGDEREAKITASVQEFLSAVRTISPNVAKSLEGLISKREVEMPKTVEELEKALTAAEKRAATAEASLATANDTIKAMTDDKAKMADELDETKKALVAATDEVIKVEGFEVRKSVIGEASFQVTKALAEKADNAELRNRAEKRFPHLTGSAEHKAKLLKFAEGLGDENDETRKGVEAILDAADRMTEKAFDRFGVLDQDGVAEARKAAAKFTEKVAEIQKRDSCSDTEAMRKARREFPNEFAAYNAAAN